MPTIDYQMAGVDISAGNEAVKRIKKAVESTFSPHVLTPIGSFAAMYDIKPLLAEYQHPVLVQSIDGVGTKMMVAKKMQQFDTIGADLVSATANDIIVMGAKPLTLLDYIANDHLNPAIIERIVVGMVKACQENGISLVGGETAEMPGTYLPGEHDLVGVITGVVEKEKAILGKSISPGDVVFALPSSGLHTNGYSLARKLCFDVAQIDVGTYVPELSQTMGEALLMPHVNYTRPILHCLEEGVEIHGMAHITGGGLLENIPRILPEGCGVEIEKKRLPILPLFSLLTRLGELNEYEAYRTFNMGIGFIIIVPEHAVHALCQAFAMFPQYAPFLIGTVVAGHTTVRIS